MNERSIHASDGGHGETPASTAGDDADDLSRRSFLELLGFSVLVAGCSRSPVREAVPFVDAPDQGVAGKPLFYATTCTGCAAGCGILAKTRDGRTIKIEGNPEAPVGGGGTCALGQASVLGLYDQRRLRGPLWRGEPMPWPEIDRRIADRLAAGAVRGERIAVVIGRDPGPTTDALLDAFADHFGAHIVRYEPISTAAIRRAHEIVYGRAVVPRYRFDRARAVVGLEADFLATWLSPVDHAHAWAGGRRPRRGAAPDAGSMGWHAQFEARLSPTGAKADLREPTAPSDLALVAARLYARLADAAGEPVPDFDALPAPSTRLARSIDAVAERLWRNRGAALVVCGLNDAEVQALVAATNDLLGAVGTTVELDPGRPSPAGDGAAGDGALAELVDDLEHGRVHGVVVYGANPVFETPFGSALATALGRVPFSVSLADRLDETAGLATAVCPDHHPLESWCDHRAMPGVRSLSQPTMQPLFDTRAAQDSLLRWMGRDESWYQRLRAGWRQARGPASTDESFEGFWNRAVHDGWARLAPTPERPAPASIVEASALTGRLLDRAGAAAAARAEDRFELVLHESVALRDGRQANNPWLLELPDPISRTSWGNHAAFAPEDLARLGLASGDRVRLDAGDARIELPAQRQPGQAPGTVAVALGYGRRAAGKAADGVGADAYALVRFEGDLLRYTGSVTVAAAGGAQPLPRGQGHDRLEGRPIVKQADLEDWLHDPAAGNHDRPEPIRLWPTREPAGRSWGMAIDLNACVGCSACVVACQAENNVPVVGAEEAARGRTMHWIRIDRYYDGPDARPDTAFQPMMCQHCANAPCESVCPVLATVHSSDGLNQQIYNRCIGTRYCANNCPYKVRRFNWFNYAKSDRFDYHMNDDLGTLVLNPDVVVRSRGVMEKCSMCVQRIQAGTVEAKLEHRTLGDGDIQTACQQACPTDAIVFGDRQDPESAVARAADDPRYYHALEELGTAPAVGYLTLVRNRPRNGSPDREEEQRHG